VNDKPLVIQSEHLADEAARWLAERCELRVVAYDDPDFADALRDAEGLIVRTYTKVTASLLDRAPRLRVVARAGTGLDNIDVDACRARNIEVVYTPDANSQSVMEYVLALIFDALRPRLTITDPVTMQQWRELRETEVARAELRDLTLGILGLGRIGRRVAEAAAALGFTILYSDLLEIPAENRHGAEPAAPEALFESSDVLTIHIDGRPSNRHFISSWLIDRMNSRVVYINTSRGFVVDNMALAQFLKSHPEAEAHLDVHDPEPFDDTYPLLHLPNAHLYPHIAGRTEAALRNMSWVVRDVVAVLEGRAPSHPAPALPQ
jgi:phosphoglycerate dehydrogenase-like enzyme